MPILARAYGNAADVIVVWESDRIAECLGFAIQRRDQSGGEPVYLPTYMPFAPDPAADPTAPPAQAAGSEPSNVWPVQRYIWADRGARGLADVQYRVLPVIGTPGSGNADLATSSAWTDPVACQTGTTAGFEMWFTRGVVATPAVSRAIQAIIEQDRAAGRPARTPHDVLQAEISRPGGQLRQDLAGPVLPALRSLLATVKNERLSIYAALYELNDPELIGLLVGLGQSCHLLLGNGSYSSGTPDVNMAAAGTLAPAVDLSRRVLAGGPFAHNKFVVVCRDGQPESVLTGSTNWTVTGLCAQSNNALLIRDQAVAQSFLSYWQRLKAAGNEPGRTIAPTNQAGAFDGPTPGSVGAPGRGAVGLRAWFTALPAPGTGSGSLTVDDLIDLGEAAKLIRSAQHGLLFLVFQPGPVVTSLLEPIEDLARAGKFVHGVINQPPTGDTAGATLTFFNRGARTDDQLSVIMPSVLQEPVAGETQEQRFDNVMIHSKLIVVDPFGTSPVIMTGSHNLGRKASAENDDNLVIITGAAGLAREYAVYIQGVFDAYKWRYERGQRRAANAPNTWQGLTRDDSWQDGQAGGPAYYEVARPQVQFWLGT